MRTRYLVISVVLAFVALAGLMFGMSHGARADVGEPYPGTVVQIQTAPLYSGHALSSTNESTVDTTYSTARDVAMWHSVDVFVYSTFATTTTITTTVQFSNDGAHWADGYWVAQNVGTTSYTTQTFSSTFTPTHEIDLIAQSATGVEEANDYAKIPIAGTQMRTKIEYMGVVTPTIWTTLRND